MTRAPQNKISMDAAALAQLMSNGNAQPTISDKGALVESHDHRIVTVEGHINGHDGLVAKVARIESELYLYRWLIGAVVLAIISWLVTDHLGLLKNRQQSPTATISEHRELPPLN